MNAANQIKWLVDKRGRGNHLAYYVGKYMVGVDGVPRPHFSYRASLLCAGSATRKTMNLLDSLPKEKLSRQEEAALVKENTERSLTKLVMHNMLEAMLYSRKVSNNLIEDDELMSVCYRSLQLCAARFDSKRAIRFFGFCKADLRGAIKRYWKSQNVVRHAVTVPLEPPAEHRENVEEGEHREPTRAEMGVEFDYEAVSVRDRWPDIEKAMTAALSELERMVLVLTYKSGFNFNETGKLVGISRSAIQQAHARSLKKIRAHLLVNGQLL